MTIAFGDAVKAARRKIYQWPGSWRVIVLCDTAQQALTAFEELQFILEASSLTVESISAAHQTLKTDRGGEFSVRVMPDRAEQIRGMEYTHIIWLYFPSVADAAVAKAQLRSGTVPHEHMVESMASMSL